jgi:hypothetical protein
MAYKLQSAPLSLLYMLCQRKIGIILPTVLSSCAVCIESGPPPPTLPYPFPLQEKTKDKEITLGSKIYVLQCTLYVHRNAHLGFFKTFIQNVLFYSLKYSELCLAGVSQKFHPG